MQLNKNKFDCTHTCYCCSHHFIFETEIYSGQHSNGLYHVDDMAEVASMNVVFIGDGILEVDVVCPKCNNINRIGLNVPQC